MSAVDFATTGMTGLSHTEVSHDDVIKWKHFPRYWPFVRGIHRWSGNSPQKDQWRGALMFSLICAWTNGQVNNRDADDLERHHHSLWRHSNEVEQILQMETNWSQIAKFMGPTWVRPGSCRSQWAPCWSHEPCYQGYFFMDKTHTKLFM